VLVVLIFSATSIRWLFRELTLIRSNKVSNTTLHPIFLSRDAHEIIDQLAKETGRKVVLAMPGIWNPTVNSDGEAIPDEFGQPVIPDLNPIISGLTGSYTYAGHWSETPNYLERRNEATRFFMRGESDQQREEFLQKTGATYIVAPSAETYGQSFADLSSLGQVIHLGNQFILIKVRL
jgi:arabinosyltransferase C